MPIPEFTNNELFDVVEVAKQRAAARQYADSGDTQFSQQATRENAVREANLDFAEQTSRPLSNGSAVRVSDMFGPGTGGVPVDSAAGRARAQSSAASSPVQQAGLDAYNLIQPFLSAGNITESQAQSIIANQLNQSLTERKNTRNANRDATAVLEQVQTDRMSLSSAFGTMKQLRSQYGEVALQQSPAWQQLTGTRVAIERAERERIQKQLNSMRQGMESSGINPQTFAGFDKDDGQPMFTVSPAEQRQMLQLQRQTVLDARKQALEEYKFLAEGIKSEMPPKPGTNATQDEIDDYQEAIRPLRSRLLKLQQRFGFVSDIGDGEQATEKLADVSMPLAPKQRDMLQRRAQSLGVELVMDEDDLAVLESGERFIWGPDGKEYVKE